MKIAREESLTLDMQPSSMEVSADSGYFADNLEHLEALEYEAIIHLIIACIQEKQYSISHDEPKESSPSARIRSQMPEKMDLVFSELFPGKRTLEDLQELLERVARENKGKAEKSIQLGVNLLFENFCQAYGLGALERIIVMLLFANSIGSRFRDLFSRLAPEQWETRQTGIKVGTILNIITRDFREQMTCRIYFGIESTLIKEEIIVADQYVRDNNMLDVFVHLHDRMIRYILGDPNGYDLSLQCISREKRAVELERVILSGDIKDRMIKLAECFFQNKSGIEWPGIDEFTGPEKGLTFLFYGPSGTGKTMLAHALAHRLNRDLLTLNLMEVNRPHMSYERAIKHIFREARLTGGIVLFDECDLFFQQGSEPGQILRTEIEKHDCMTILVTNKPVEMDPFLDRIITLKVPMTLPDEIEREEIWKALIPANVVLNEKADLRKLAQKYVFTGRSIKKTLFMAIRSTLQENNGSRFILTQEEIEKAAVHQNPGIFDPIEVGETYNPQRNLAEVNIREQDRNWLQRLVAAYKEFQGLDLGIIVVLGSTDIQTGLDCVEGVARQCDLRVKKLSFPRILLSEYQHRFKDPRTQREISGLDYAFENYSGQQAMTVFFDPDGLFEYLLRKNQESPSGVFIDFVQKIRAFKGLFCLVTKPLQKTYLPIEFPHHIEIKHPSEEIQIHQWESYLPKSGSDKLQIVDLVKNYPMHLKEIDYFVYQAKISAMLNGVKGPLNLIQIFTMIGRLGQKNKTRALFEDGRIGNRIEVQKKMYKAAEGRSNVISPDRQASKRS